MCRNIRTLHHFDPPATGEEVGASALQYVRKLSGMRAPSRANQVPFDRAVEKVTAATLELLGALEPHGPPRVREEEQRKAALRGQRREERLRARLTRAPA
jgi:hypothetical protein